MPEASFAVHVEAPLPQLIPPPVTVPDPVTDTESWKDVVPPVNVAFTLFALFITTAQVGVVPEQAPPQPVKVAPEDGVAVSVTVAFAVWLAVHVLPPAPQLIPTPVTVPLPVTVTVSAKPLGPPIAPPVKVAETLLATFIRTVQVVAVPPQAPVQPPNVAPVAGVATSVTVAVGANVPEQTLAPRPQLIAPKPPLTLPLPTTATVSGTACAKVAVTERSTSIVSVQVGPVPAQGASVPQPVKT
jgi:hypothetical protein